MKYSWDVIVDGKVKAKDFDSIYDAIGWVEKAVDDGVLDNFELPDGSGYCLEANRIEFVRDRRK
jgi:hypothetical protein